MNDDKKEPKVIYDDNAKTIRTYMWMEILGGLRAMEGWVVVDVQPYPPSHHVT